MRNDFAKRKHRTGKTANVAKARGTKAGSARKNSRKAPAKSQNSRPPRRFFHGPSFSGGMVLGALMVVLVAYAPEMISSQLNATVPAPKAEPPKLEFEFEEMLQSSEVVADPRPYATQSSTNTNVPARPSQTYFLQAASFRSDAEANELRAKLLLKNLPAKTDEVVLADGRWHRVTVGPFTTTVEAQRAMTKLREQGIAPLWIEKGA